MDSFETAVQLVEKIPCKHNAISALIGFFAGALFHCGEAQSIPGQQLLEMMMIDIVEFSESIDCHSNSLSWSNFETSKTMRHLLMTYCSTCSDVSSFRRKLTKTVSKLQRVMQEHRRDDVNNQIENQSLTFQNKADILREFEAYWQKANAKFVRIHAL